MSVQLDILTYNIEVDIISDTEVLVNIIDGITVYQNGTKVANVNAIDFKDGTNTTVRVVLSNGRVLVYIDSTASGSGGGVTSFNSRTGAVAPVQADYDSFFLTQAEGDALYQAISLAALKANNLSDLSSASTARTNLGATTVGGGLFTVSNPSAIRYIKINADNTISLRTAAEMLTDLAPAKVLVVACSDETTALTAGTGKVTFRMPYAMTVTAVRASLVTAQTSGNIFTVDINDGGTTILSTKLTIDNTEKTSTTAATPAVISDTALNDDAEITVDIDQIGDSTAKGLKITLIGT